MGCCGDANCFGTGCTRVSNWCGLCCQARESRDKKFACINQKRNCTDVNWLFFFTIISFASWYIFGYAIAKGANPERLRHGIDWQGNSCGVDPDVINEPFVMWPDPTTFDVQVCVENCTESQNQERMFITYESTPLLFFCIPSVVADINITAIEGFSTLQQEAARGIGDLETSRTVIAISCVLALVLAFMYLIVMKRIAKIVVWFCIFLVTVLGFIFSLSLFFYSQNVQLDPERADWIHTCSIIGLVAVGVWVIFIFYVKQRIQIAIEIVKSSADVVFDMWTMIVFPVFPFIGLVLFVIWWMYVALFIFSVFTHTPGTPLPPPPTAFLPEVPDFLEEAVPDFYKNSWDDIGIGNDPDGDGVLTYTYSEHDRTFQNALFLQFFILLWVTQIVIYVTYCVVAGAVADWYFTRVDDRGRKIRGTKSDQLHRFPVVMSFWRVIRYHLGSVMFGAAIIAVLQTIRALVAYIERQTKHQESNVQKIVFMIIQLFLKCVQCCCEKITKNAFIYMAIYGDAFCVSAFGSFAILWRNLIRVAAINMIGSWIVVMGKLAVAIISTMVAFQLLENGTYLEGATEISNLFYPLSVTMVLSYCVATLFMIIYETTIDTVFICFLVDDEHNKKGEMFASKPLQKLVGKYAPASAKLAHEILAPPGPRDPTPRSTPEQVAAWIGSFGKRYTEASFNFLEAAIDGSYMLDKLEYDDTSALVPEEYTLERKVLWNKIEQLRKDHAKRSKEVEGESRPSTQNFDLEMPAMVGQGHGGHVERKSDR